MIRNPYSIAAAAFALYAAAPAAHALEAFKAYDNFAGTSLGSTLWQDGERARSIRAGQLNLMQRTWGSALSNSGSGAYNFDEHFIDPTDITAIRAKINVTALDVNACSANTTVTQSRARIIAALFNSATPTPGSEVNDVLAQVRLTRFSNATDPAGVLQVQGLINLCTSADCNAATTIGFVDLGTVPIGTAATVQFQWDKANKMVLFSRDNGAFAGSATYTVPDGSPPGAPFAALSTRLDVASCISSPPVEGSVNALFDNIAVNRRAAP